MANDTVHSKRLADLRRKAEAKLEQETSGALAVSPDEVRTLVYDLQSHQIELEMQNEELRQTQQELVESRDRYSDLYDFAPVGYVTVSHQGTIVDVNLTLAELLGVERPGMMQHPLSAFILPDDQDVYYRNRRNILASGKRDTCRLRMLRRDAEPLWVEMETILIKAQDEKHFRLRTIISDVTERKQSEADKLALERQLQHAQKLESLGVLAGGIAHDFNNLLAAILGNADLALDKLAANSPLRGFLQEIKHASRRAAELANQMLTYAGKSGFDVQKINISELVDEMGHMLNVSMSKKAELKYNFSGEPATFNGDVTQIRQVVMNLITNASEAIGDNRGVVTLSSGTIKCNRAYLDTVNEVLQAGMAIPLAEGDYAYLEVADTGCGMARGVVEKIFDPFFTTKFKGRGLGMSAVLGIVHRHKGALKIDSEVGRGTNFTVLFPSAPPEEIAVEVQTNVDAESHRWRGQGTVLLADDEDAVRQVGKAMLERLGFTVLTARDGREALEVFREQGDEVVCVCLDLTMPHMDGEETFHEMRRLKPDVTVILCSGYEEQDVADRFADGGLAGFIQKPFDMGALKAQLMRALPDN